MHRYMPQNNKLKHSGDISQNIAIRKNIVSMEKADNVAGG